MPFRIGRTLARHFYPERRSGNGSSSLLARNFATGPKSDTPVQAGGTQIPWNLADVGGFPGSVDVQITPISTGVVLVWGVVTVENTSGASRFLQVQVVLDGVTVQPIPLTEKTTVLANGNAAVPFLAEVTMSLGLHNIEILLTAEVDLALAMLADSSALSIQEVPVATG